MTKQTLKKVGLWALTVLMALSFLAPGVGKLAGAAQIQENFARWGYPPWFMYVTGAIEVVAALLLLWPRTATLGGGLLVGTMVGAILTHLNAGEPEQVVAPLVLMGLAALVAWLWRGEVVAPLRRFMPGLAQRGART